MVHIFIVFVILYISRTPHFHFIVIILLLFTHLLAGVGAEARVEARTGAIRGRAAARATEVRGTAEGIAGGTDIEEGAALGTIHHILGL